MKKWLLYRHTSPSGKVYIGITSRPAHIRWGHNGYNYRGQVFVNAIMKYGWDNIKHEILFTNLSEKKAKQLEIDLIRHYKNLGISYNMTDGGDGTVGFYPSEETREKMRKAQRKIDKSLRAQILNRNREQIGIKHRKAIVQLSLEGNYIATFDSGKNASISTHVDASMITACCKNRQFKAGGFLWMYLDKYLAYKNEGIIEEILLEMANKAKAVGGKYIRTETWRKKRSESMKGKDRRSSICKKLMEQRSIEAKKRPVMQLTIDEKILAVYPSIKSVEQSLGFSSSYISRCCNNKREAAYGFKWQFITKEEYYEYKEKLEAA